MTTRRRRRFTAAFKKRVVLEALRGDVIHAAITRSAANPSARYTASYFSDRHSRSMKTLSRHPSATVHRAPGARREDPVGERRARKLCALVRVEDVRRARLQRRLQCFHAEASVHRVRQAARPQSQAGRGPPRRHAQSTTPRRRPDQTPTPDRQQTVSEHQQHIGEYLRLRTFRCPPPVNGCRGSSKPRLKELGSRSSGRRETPATGAGSRRTT